MGMRLVGFVPASSAASCRGQGAACLLCSVFLLSIALQLGSGTERVAPAGGSFSAEWLDVCGARAMEGRSI